MRNSIYTSDKNNGAYIQLSRRQIAYLNTHRNITPSQYEALNNLQIVSLISYCEQALNMKTNRH
jgi:hypothetical protein